MEKPWEGRTVVIVDDNAKTRTELRDLYSQVGLNVIGEAEDGIAALEVIKDVKPDLVSLDIIMPNMDGMECYRELKKDGEMPMVVFVSALSSEHRVTDCYGEEIGLERFIPKPVTRELLESRMASIFGLGLPPADNSAPQPEAPH